MGPTPPPGDLHHLAAAYALDALDADERRAFEAHFPTCEVCHGDVGDFRDVAATLAAGVATAPPTDLRDRVLAEIAHTRQLPPQVTDDVVDLDAARRARRGAFLAAAAAALLVIGGLFGVLIGRDGGGGRADDVLAAPDAVVSELDTAAADGGAVRVVWSSDRGEAAVFGSDLLAEGDGRVYALWAVVGEGVTPVGLFGSDDGVARAVLDVGDVAADGWGVTIEPAGGSPQPTGDILYLGQI